MLWVCVSSLLLSVVKFYCKATWGPAGGICIETRLGYMGVSIKHWTVMRLLFVFYFKLILGSFNRDWFRTMIMKAL